MDGFSIITPTVRSFCIDNIIKNYLNQKVENKELIIVVNSDTININDFDEYLKLDSNIKVFKVEEDFSLGKCLNFGIEQSKYDKIAKFDDDDYYSPYYLIEAQNTFISQNCDIVGKKRIHYYMEKDRLLLLRNRNIENKFTDTITGSTICFKRYVFEKVKFKDVNKKEDYHFNTDCKKMGFKIYATSRYNHLVLKHKDKKTHTYPVDQTVLIKNGTKVKDNISFEEACDFLTKEEVMISI